MSGSEITPGDETIVREYMAAYWNELGLAQGRTQHACISARLAQREEGRQALEAYEALALVAQTLEAIPEEPTRSHIQAMLRHEFGNTEDTEYLLNDLKAVWETFDLLIELFGIEDARKMINAVLPPASS